MIAPRFATIALALDTERWKMMREGERHGAMYLIDRLLSGETVAATEFDRLGIGVQILPAAADMIRGKGNDGKE